MFKSKNFKLLDIEGNEKNPVDGDYYFNDEWVFINKFPFIKKDMMIYQFTSGEWKRVIDIK